MLVLYTNSYVAGAETGLTCQTNSIPANHSDFGGILPLFKQYSAIPIGMAVFRQNPKFTNSVVVTP